MQWLRFPIFYKIALFLFLIVALLAADKLCYALALPIRIDIAGGSATLKVGSQDVSARDYKRSHGDSVCSP